MRNLFSASRIADAIDPEPVWWRRGRPHDRGNAVLIGSDGNNARLAAVLLNADKTAYFLESHLARAIAVFHAGRVDERDFLMLFLHDPEDYREAFLEIVGNKQHPVESEATYFRSIINSFCLFLTSTVISVLS